MVGLRRRGARAGVAAALIVGLSGGGCAWSAFEDARHSREARRECEARHGEGDPACDPARAQEDADYDRYERESRRSWGCETASPDGRCPIER